MNRDRDTIHMGSRLDDVEKYIREIRSQFPKGLTEITTELKIKSE